MIQPNEAQTTPLPVTALPDEGPSDSTIISELEGKFKDAERSSKEQERMWMENIRMVEGFHWLRSGEMAVLNVSGQTARGRQRITDNILQDNARRLHARMDSVKFAPLVMSDTDDPADRDAAKAANGFLKWFVRRKKIAKRKRALNWWIIACGVAYLEGFYDPEAGPIKNLPVLGKDGEPEMEPALGEGGIPIMDPAYGDDGQAIIIDGVPKLNARQRPKFALRPIGDVDFMVRSAFQIRRDPRTQEWDKMRWLFVVEPAAREDVIDRYGDAFPDLDATLPKDTKVSIAPWIPQLPPGQEDLTGLPRPSPSVGGVLDVKRYYERASRKHSKGRHYVYVGDKLLHKGDLDTPDGDIPVKKFGYLDRPWVLEGKGPIEGAKGLMRLYNRIFSRWGEHMIRLHIGWLLVPSTAGIPRRAFTNEIASVIRYAPGGGAPEFVTPPLQGLQWYEALMNRVERSIENRMALPPVLKGQVPKGMKAARGLELLKESADEIQQPVLADQADSWAEFYTMMLGLGHKHFTVERLVSWIGDDKLPQAMQWKGEVLPQDWREKITVKVEAGESLPASASGRRDFILQLAGKFLLFGDPKTDPNYRTNLRNVLELDAGFAPTDQDQDDTIASEENIKLLHAPPPQEGAPSVVETLAIYDDLVHLRNHISFAKRLVISGRRDEAKRMIPHIVEHQEKLMEKAKAAAAQHPTPPGGGAAKPEGGQIAA